MLLLVSILGLLGQSTTKSLIDNLARSPRQRHVVHQDSHQNAQRQQATASVLGIVGLILAFVVGVRLRRGVHALGQPHLWHAGRLADLEDRADPAWHHPFTVVCLVAGLVIVVVSGAVADQIGKTLGAGDTAILVWEIVKWPVLLIIFVVLLAALSGAAPNVRHPSFRWISPGAIFAVIVWLVASGLFALYVANFSSYNKTKGSLAAVIIFLGSHE